MMMVKLSTVKKGKAKQSVCKKKQLGCVINPFAGHGPLFHLFVDDDLDVDVDAENDDYDDGDQPPGCVIHA